MDYLGVKIKVTPNSSKLQKGQVMFLCNHRSWADFFTDTYLSRSPLHSIDVFAVVQVISAVMQLSLEFLDLPFAHGTRDASGCSEEEGASTARSSPSSSLTIGSSDTTMVWSSTLRVTDTRRRATSPWRPASSRWLTTSTAPSSAFSPATRYRLEIDCWMS